MKTLLVAMCVVFVAIFVIGCSGDPKSEAEVKQAQAEWNQQTADNVVDLLVYIKDPRPNPPICFAYKPMGPSSVISTVLCEAIPPDMLFTAKIKVK